MIDGKQTTGPSTGGDRNGDFPREGFLRIFEGSAPQVPPAAAAGAGPWTLPQNIDEGADLDNLKGFCSTDHGLHFAVKLRGNNRGVRTSGAARPPLRRARRVASPLGTGFAVTPASPRASKYA